MDDFEIAAALESGGYLAEVAMADHRRVIRGAIRARACGRGLLLSGPTGCGKTLAMRCLYPATPPPRYDCRWIDCYEADQVGWLDDRDIFGWAGCIVLDDLGAEKIVSDYGVLREPIADFFMRLSRLRDSGGPSPTVCVTTNLGSAQIAGRYGERMVSRLLDAVVPAVLSGEDKRGRV